MDGYFRYDGMDGYSLTHVADAVAHHVLQPYGSNPTLRPTVAGGQEARLILPSADQPMGMVDAAVLIVRYPRPVWLGSQTCRFFALYADKGHIQDIAETLRFTSGPSGTGVAVMDDNDRNCAKYGTARYWHTAHQGYGGTLTWTWNNDYRRSGYNWARWYPDLKPGRYEVFAYIPQRYNTTTAARYWVSHQSGHTLRVVNQSVNGGRWVSLGTYTFRGTRSDRVSLSDVTYETYATRMIAFDAVKWEPR
jgi:hypothetical protein